MVRRSLVNAVHAALDVGELLVSLWWKGPDLSGALDDTRAVVGGDPEPDPEPSPPPPPEVPQPIVQWGLLLPDGNVVWENSLWNGVPLASPQQRSVLVSILRRTAADLNFDEKAFLGHYSWARRVGVPAVQWGEEVAIFPLVESEVNGSEPQTNHEEFFATMSSNALETHTEGESGCPT
jgi:hypothetical protein